MTPGFVYILLNPSHKNMIKVGKTTRPPQERADNLSNHSGVPTKFFVAYWVMVSDMDAVESKMHIELKNMRVNKNREFFNLESKKAIDLLIKIAKDHRYLESEVQIGAPAIRCLCGREITKNQKWCPKCGRDNPNYFEKKKSINNQPTMVCECGREIRNNQQWCPKCGRDNDNYIEERPHFS